MEVKYRSYFLKNCEKAWVSWKSAVIYTLLRAGSEFVTHLGIIRYKSPCNTFEHLWVSWKSVKWKSYFTSGHKWSFALSTVFFRFGQNSLQEMSTNCSFREDQRSESLRPNNLLEGSSEYLLPTFVVRCQWKSVQEKCLCCCWTFISFLKIDIGKVALCLWV